MLSGAMLRASKSTTVPVSEPFLASLVPDEDTVVMLELVDVTVALEDAFGNGGSVSKGEATEGPGAGYSKMESSELLRSHRASSFGEVSIV